VRLGSLLRQRAVVSGTAAMLLTLCCAPAVASTGVEDLSIDIDESAVTSPAIMIELTPRVASILREIFDERVPDQQSADDATIGDTSIAATPLAELPAPNLREQSRKLDEANVRKPENDLTRINTNLSDFSEDQLARFRQQMFRTDI